MPVALKGNKTQSGDLRRASLGMDMQVGGFLDVGGGGGGGNPIAPNRDDSSNADERSGGQGMGGDMPFLPDSGSTLPVSKPRGADSMLNVGADLNGSNSEMVFAPAKDKLGVVDDFAPSDNPVLDEHPADAPEVPPEDFADNVGAGGNDSYYGGGGGGGYIYRDVSPWSGELGGGLQTAANGKSAKGKRLYIWIIVALAALVIIYLSRKNKKKRR